MDFVINLCDEPLPRLPGNPFIAHWGITDPMSQGSDAAREALAFRRTFRELETRIRLFVVLRHQSREERLSHGEHRAEAA
jgi:arsenate reductase